MITHKGAPIPDTIISPAENTALSPAGDLLRVTGLELCYGQRRAIHDISFSVGGGEIVGLLGPNGAGKSSIMRMISGVLPASAGHVSINGLDLAHEPLATRRLIGFLPEQPPLYDDLTVDEYLHFCADLRGVTAIGEAVATAKNACALSDTGGRLINNLSKGYRQRLGIAQAIVHAPPLVILDEPTIGLDPVQIHEIRSLIRHLGKTHGIILSTHILTEAQQICNRILIIHQGRIVLTRSMGESAGVGYVTRFSRPPPELELAKRLKADVRRLDNDRFLIRGCTAEDMSDRLVPLSVKLGWRLMELTPETDALESIFLRITQKEMP